MSEKLRDTDPRAYEELQKAARKIIDPSVISTWDDAWQVLYLNNLYGVNIPLRRAKATPWDAGATQPPLQDLIEGNPTGIEWPKTGVALVPGCGGVNPFYLRHWRRR